MAHIHLCKNTFPLIKENVYKDAIQEYWKDKPVRFAERNNCVGCFHRNPILLNLMSKNFLKNMRGWNGMKKKAGRKWQRMARC